MGANNSWELGLFDGNHHATGERKTYRRRWKFAAKPADAGVIAPEYPLHCSAAPKAWAVLCISAVVSDAAHARPEEGRKGLGLSLPKLQRGVSFGADEFDPVDIIITGWRRLISIVISK